MDFVLNFNKNDHNKNIIINCWFQSHATLVFNIMRPQNEATTEKYASPIRQHIFGGGYM